LFRRALVFLQFSVSIGLIIGTFIVYDQVQYCLNKDPGFEKEQVVVLPLRSRSVMVQYGSFRNELLQNSSVLNAAGSSTVPGRSVGSRGMFPEGNQWHPRNSMFVDYDFIQTFGIEKKIEPLVLHMSPGVPSYLSIRLQRENIFKSMSYLRDTWQKFHPGHPFDYFFLDESFDSLYKSEEKMSRVFQIFTILGFFISCLGLYGLSSYLLDQRTKEIGIRKVLGASVPRILIMVSKEFIRWVVLANIAAWPIIYFVMKRKAAKFCLPDKHRILDILLCIDFGLYYSSHNSEFSGDQRYLC